MSTASTRWHGRTNSTSPSTTPRRSFSRYRASGMCLCMSSRARRPVKGCGGTCLEAGVGMMEGRGGGRARRRRSRAVMISTSFSRQGSSGWGVLRAPTHTRPEGMDGSGVVLVMALLSWNKGLREDDAYTPPPSYPRPGG